MCAYLIAVSVSWLVAVTEASSDCELDPTFSGVLVKYRDSTGVCREIGSRCYLPYGNITGTVVWSRWIYAQDQGVAACCPDLCAGTRDTRQIRYEGRCYANENPCGPDMQLFEDYQLQGYCDCIPEHIYVSEEDRCYLWYTQGPCPENSFLVFEGQPKCRRELRCSREYRWWPGGAGYHSGCYRLCPSWNCADMGVPCLMHGSLGLSWRYSKCMWATYYGASPEYTFAVFRDGLGGKYHQLVGSLDKSTVETRRKMFRSSTLKLRRLHYLDIE